MKASRVNKIVSFMLASVFVLVVLSAAGVSASKTFNTVSGTVISVDADAGKLVVVDKAGKTLELQAQSDKNPKTLEQLKTIQEGDRVTVEFDNKGVIQSISMQMNK